MSPGTPRNSNGLELVAPDSSGRFWYSSYFATTGSWSTPVQIASGFRATDAVLGNGTKLRHIGYTASFQVGLPSPSPLYLSYSTSDGTRHRIHTVICGTGSHISCTEFGSVLTPADSNALFPALASVRNRPADCSRAHSWSIGMAASDAAALNGRRVTRH